MDVWRIVGPVAAIAYLTVYALLGARLTVNHGLGWDGNLYADLARSFPAAIGAGISPYMSWRILPSAIIHTIARVGLIDLSDPANVVMCFRVYNGVLFVSSAWLWGLVSAGRSRVIAVLGFLGLFVNFHAMVGIQFSSVQTDTTALFLGLAMLYGWLNDRPLIVFAAGLAGAFTWPTALIAGLFLLVFPRAGGGAAVRLPGRVWLAAGAALAFAGLLTYAVGSGQTLCCGAPQVDYLLIGPSAAIAIAYVFYIAYAATGTAVWAQRTAAVVRSGGAAVLLVVTVYGLHAFERVLHGLPGGQGRAYLLGSALTAVAKPAAFLIAHITYLGPLFLLCLVWAPSLFRTASNAGLGATGVLVLFFAMTVNSESRQLYFFWPFVVYLLGEAMTNSGVGLRGTPMIALVISSLVLSKFYLPLGGPMPDNPDGLLLTEFPWQWFFMNEGPWMSWSGYAINLALALAAATILLTGWRSAWRSGEQTRGSHVL